MTDLSDNLQTMFRDALDFAWATIRRTIPKVGLKHPLIGREDLTYALCEDEQPDFWVESFWTGQLWLAYVHTKDPYFLEAAQAQRDYYLGRLNRPQTFNHDLGFLYTHSLVAEYKIMGEPVAREGALRAADALTRRYNPAGRFIQAWDSWGGIDNRGRIIIDCMENLALLYWASEQTGDRRYADIADAHAHTNTQHIVRADGSSYHTFFFNPETGAPVGGKTHQGYADESCWSRGQAWGIHGYSVAYRYTGNPEHAATARCLIDYTLPRLPADSVPYYDYRLPDDVPHYRDTSAAAIMAAGMLNLADQIPDGAHYREAAYRILAGLCEHYTTKGHPQAEGLLVQGASHVGGGRADNMLPYGDYYFVEGLLRALGHTDFAW